MNEDEYEYMLSAMGMFVLVRRKPNPTLGIPAENWRTYMTCDSKAQAESVIALLQNPMGKEAVRP